MLKLFVLAVALAAVHAGFLPGQNSADVTSPSLVTSQPSNLLRNPSGNVAQVSSYSKTIDAPYSSQSKSDVRINSPGVYAHEGPIIYNSHSHSHGVPPSGFARQDVPQYSSRPSVSHVTYNTGPVAYANAPASLGQDTSYGPSYTDHTIGSSRENTEVQSLNGNHAVTHYSKAVDTAFSTIRKSDSRGTSDEKIVSVAPATLTYATASTYASPLTTKVNPTVAYSSAPVVAHASFSGLGTRYEW